MKRKFKPPAFTTVIGAGTVIDGGLSFSGGLHLDGEILGDVIADSESKNSTLTVSDQARIVGNVSAANIIVNGSIEGDVYSSSLIELAEHARISGQIHYQQLEMAMGASVDGGMVRLSEGEVDQAEAVDAYVQEADDESALDEDDVAGESWREQDDA